MLIQQAIFTSAETERAQGYQLVSHSSGLSEADGRELAVWAPSHDSLVDRPGEQVSVNFHRLSSGVYCVSRTTLAGAEYSGRRGPRVYTHFLVMPGDVLARFSNNPFAVLRAAMATGALAVRRQHPAELAPLRLGGRAPAVDMGLLARLANDPGPTAMATLVQATLASDRLAVAGRTPLELLVAGLFSVLPVECRVELSFTTGLKLSPTRSVRLMALAEERATWRTVARSGVTLVDLDAPAASEAVHWDGWAGAVAEILASGKFEALAVEFERPRAGLCLANVDDLCQGIRARIEDEPTDAPQSLTETAFAGETAFATPRAESTSGNSQRAWSTAGQASPSAVADLAESLAAQPPEILELLERIDDVVFAAIGGDAEALAQLQMLWPVAAEELEEDLFEQSREQYLRCALSICSECVAGEVRRPERAIAAVDVLCVLFEE